MIQNFFKTQVNEQNVLCLLHFNILADVWSDWAGWSSCSVDCRGICNRNRNRTCLNETCSSDQAVSKRTVFRMNDTEIEEEECNYNHTACKGNVREKRELPFVRGSLQMRIMYYNLISKNELRLSVQF